MPQPEDKLPDLPASLLTFTGGGLNRRTFLTGTAVLLTLPLLAQGQSKQPAVLTNLPHQTKPYLMAQLVGHSPCEVPHFEIETRFERDK
jgi:hypothetical protein